MIEDKLTKYASTQIDKALSYSEAMRQGYIQAKEFEGELWIKATHYHIQKQEQGEPVCDKDPRGCWSISCQLGKKCKNTPQTKKWIGLTENQIDKLEKEFIGFPVPNIYNFVKSIEDKLKEKNT